MNNFFLFLLLLVFVFSCRDDQYDFYCLEGTQKEGFGGSIYKYAKIDQYGQLSLTRHDFNSKNCLKNILNYKGGNLHGLQRGFHDDGAIQSICRYFNGKKSGNCKIFHPNGMVLVNETYSDDSLVHSYIYNEYGKLKKRIKLTPSGMMIYREIFEPNYSRDYFIQQKVLERNDNDSLLVTFTLPIDTLYKLDLYFDYTYDTTGQFITEKLYKRYKKRFKHDMNLEKKFYYRVVDSLNLNYKIWQELIY